MTEKNVKYLLIGTANADIMAAGTQITQASDITEGVLAVVDGTNTTVKTEQSSGKVRIAQRYGDDIIYSPFIDVTKISRKVGISGEAAKQQISYVGFNGSTGQLDADNEADYILKPIIYNVEKTYNNSPFIAHWAYKSGASATQYEVAAGLIEKVNIWQSRFHTEVMEADAVTATPVDATNDFLGNATVVKGTPAFTVAESSGSAADAGQYATDTEIAVGDFVRIGAVGGSTTIKNNVYKVTAVANVSSASATITVDRPINNASGTYAAATSDIEVIPAASIGNMGIKFVGLPLAVDAQKFTYDIVRFDIGIEGDFTSLTNYTLDQAPTYGIGTFGQVAPAEYKFQMNEGKAYVQAYPSPGYRTEASKISSSLYPLDQVRIDGYDDNFTPLLGDNPKSYFNVVIYTPNATALASLKTVFGIS